MLCVSNLSTTIQAGDLIDAVRETLIDGGWLPMDGDVELDDAADQRTLEWVEARCRFDAFILLPGKRFGFCRFGDEGIDLTISDRRYVIDAEVHFPLSTIGVYLFANTIVNLDDLDTVVSA